ncbi:MAG: ZIP family metal transporter [Verrucomicrobiia bacterium]|jgi:zinc transporter ZupT
MDYLILITSIVLGAITVFGFKLDEARHVKMLNAFIGGFLITLTFLHLLPELYQSLPVAEHDQDHGHQHASSGQVFLGALILAGFLGQVAIETFSKGIEHGHSHKFSNSFPWAVMIGLCIHAVSETLALGNAHDHHDNQSRSILLWSIALHKFPATIALVGMLTQSGISRSRTVLCVVVFGCMGPLGVFISAHSELAHYSRELMAVVIGIFLHLSTTILFESDEGHHYNVRKAISIALGVALGSASVLH